MMKRLVAILISCLAFLTVSGDILYWQVDENATVDTEPNTTLYSYLGNLPYSTWSEDAETYTEYLAQVVVVNNNGQTVAILPAGWSTGETNPYSGNPMWQFDPDVTVVEIGHPDAGYVGSAWNVSQLYHDMLEEYLFQVQILQDSSGTDNIILFSDYVRGLDLMDDKHTYIEGTLNPPIETPWVPGVYHIVPPSLPSVPEPSSALLCIIGFGMLMLRRKTSKWENG
jgi:hypothetical protein